MADLAARLGPLDGRDAITLPGRVSVTVKPPTARAILRGDDAVRARAGEVFGVALPAEACRATSAGDGRAALWLGPDEWLLLAPGGAAFVSDLEDALAGRPHALVDVSHRQIALAVEGPGAEDLLSAGCPLDLHVSAFPIGMATRTLLAKTEIVLWRTGPEAFHLEVWRSFAAYAWAFLAEAARQEA